MTDKDMPLLPCPFCDGTPEHDFTYVNKDTIIHYFVRCISCAAEGGWCVSKNGAARLWNMRPTNTRADTAKDDVGELLAQYKAENPTHSFTIEYCHIDDAWKFCRYYEGCVLWETFENHKTPAEAITAAMQKVGQ